MKIGIVYTLLISMYVVYNYVEFIFSILLLRHESVLAIYTESSVMSPYRRECLVVLYLKCNV